MEPRSKADAASAPKGPSTPQPRPCPVVDIANLVALVGDYAEAHGLSGQERAVLLLGARGLHRKGAAVHLGCSPGTVDTYWNRILRKRQLSSQLEVLAELLSLALDGSTRAPLYRRSGHDS
jgi:DNA-binding CsgD family transcriptional regulator